MPSERRDYCKVALKLIGIETVCGRGCPIFNDCPRLIMENAGLKIDAISNKAIERAIKAMTRSLDEKTKDGSN